MAYKTKFKPQNSKKYVGNPNNIICRSLWERKVCKFLDENSNVLRWSSEEFSLPYMSPVDNRPHKYYPDFLAEIKGKDETIRTHLIEVKPYKQTKPPVKPKRKNKTYVLNEKTYAVNHAKWEAAKQVCNQNDWQFTILTENEIFKENR
jgi:hypothetical protein|tara:strand:- start:2154 stop:2597 length:444 start_codon:yes stop_codon:yes gene_type:complete